MSRLPNLFIIGAMKSGTTSLYHYLDSHPEVSMATTKEPEHFSTWEKWSKGNSDYLSIFPDAENVKYIGEASTGYSKLPRVKGVPERLFEFNSAAKIIYIVREPFKRIVSQYKHMVRTGREKHRLTDALTHDNEYLTNSYYAYQLKPYLEIFGADSVFVETFEALVEDPETFCKNLFIWLGIDSDFVPPTVQKAFHVSPKKWQTIDEDSILGRSAMKIMKSGMHKIFPGAVREKIKNRIPKKIDIDFDSDAFKQEVTKADALCAPIMNTWNSELSILLERPFEAWNNKENAENNELLVDEKRKLIMSNLDKALNEQ